MNGHQVTKEFERALCEYTGAQYAVAVNSCTMALTLAVAWHYERARWLAQEGDQLLAFLQKPFEVEIPSRTYVGVPYAIREAGAKPVFRYEDWRGSYRLEPLPVWDSARLFTKGMFAKSMFTNDSGPRPIMHCVSFHWSKTLGIQQGGAILHDNHEADGWLRRARFDGRNEGIPPKMDTFPLRRAWHCYMSPEIAAAGLMRLAFLPGHNRPLPNDDYPDLSAMEAFR